jgi:hypothetical protein
MRMQAYGALHMLIVSSAPRRLTREWQARVGMQHAMNFGRGHQCNS